MTASMTNRQSYIDAYERHYQNARDGGYPRAAAAALAALEATREIETPVCGGCDGELIEGFCPSCEEPHSGMTEALAASRIHWSNKERAT